MGARYALRVAYSGILLSIIYKTIHEHHVWHNKFTGTALAYLSAAHTRLASPLYKATLPQKAL